MYFHGTNSNKEFNNLIHNELGIIWFTKDKPAAIKYAKKYYNKGDSRVFCVKITGRILDFTDKENEIIKEIIQRIKSSYLFDIESHWEQSAAFDVIERNYWIIDFIKEKGYSGLYCLDSTYGLDHHSIALFDNEFVIDEIEVL